jgi:hypothetical protein
MPNDELPDELVSPLRVAIRGACISMLAILVFTELLGLGFLRREHLGSYVAAIGVAFVAHYFLASAFRRSLNARESQSSSPRSAGREGNPDTRLASHRNGER